MARKGILLLNLGSPITVELAGLAGFDWLLIDHEHGPGGQDTLLHQLQAAAATPAFAVVRIAQNETARFKRVLDMGASGVMVPYVNTAAEARAAVSAMRYPPHGVRGVAKFNRGAGFGGDFEDYYLHAHERLLGVLQIETPEAVAAVDAIAAVPGVDGLFIGPGDLSLRLGCPMDWSNPKMVAAEDAVAAAAARHGKAWGRPSGSTEDIAHLAQKGARLIAHGSDFGAVMRMMPVFAKTMKDGLGEA